MWGDLLSQLANAEPHKSGRAGAAVAHLMVIWEVLASLTALLRPV